MFTNIDSLLRAGLLQKYSFVFLLLSILCIGVDSVSVLMFCLNSSFHDEIKMRLEYVETVRLNGQGIWCGILGITVAFICNVLAIDKNRETMNQQSEDHVRIQQKILNTEAGLFAWTIFVSIVSFCGVLMSGYSSLELIARNLMTTQIEQMVLLFYITETLLILGLCLTTFTLSIYSFNVLLPLYYSSLIHDISSGVICHRRRNDKWKESPNCEFGRHSFSGSSIQFGTIETLSERSIPALTRKLSIKRFNDNLLDRPRPLPIQTILPSNRNDLIIL